MIAVDTSALMAILLNEPEAAHCAEALANERVLVSAGTAVEALIVAERRGLRTEMAELIEGLELEVVEVSSVNARKVADAYGRWGKGVHPASLNFGDCFAYEVAKTNDCPLLYVGQDFVRTDIASVPKAQGGKSGRDDKGDANESAHGSCGVGTVRCHADR